MAQLSFFFNIHPGDNYLDIYHINAF